MVLPGPACGPAGPLRPRVANPYYDYDKFDFEIRRAATGHVRPLPRADGGDAPEPAHPGAGLDGIPEGPHKVQTGGVLPRRNGFTRSSVLSSSTSNHRGRHHPPQGEVYSATEAANGVLGYYIVSDGTKNPMDQGQAACFAIYQALPQLTKEVLVADLIAIIAV